MTNKKEEKPRIKIENKKSEIIEAFKKLGFTFKHRGHGFYWLVKPDGKETYLEFWFPQDNDKLYRIEKDLGDYNGAICFMMDGCFFEWLDEECISLVPKVPKKNPQTFINFSNHRVEEKI